MKIITIILVVSILVCFGCASKNYSAMTDGELQKALSSQQESYDRNAADYYKWAGGGDPTVYIGRSSAVAGAQLGSGLGCIFNAVVSAKSAQTNKEEMEKIKQEMERRGN